MPDSADSLDDGVEQLSALSPGVVRAVRDSTHLLLARRNTLAPIARLPWEIVGYIMQLATSHIAPWDEKDWIFHVLHAWLPMVYNLTRISALSHVCRSWRQIALATATLWARAYPLIDEPFLSTLGRASGAPLTLTRGHSRKYGVRLPQTTELERLWSEGSAEELMERMQHLWLTEDFLFMNGLAAPQLESFHTRATRGYRGPYDLPRNAPRLHTLVLQEANLKGEQLRTLVDSLILPQLRRLAISFEDSSWNTCEDVVNLLDVIQRASLIEHLAVRIWYRPDEWIQWWPERATFHDQVVLPRLSRLTLLGDQMIVVALLHHVQLPKNVDLYLDPIISHKNPDWPELDAQRDFVKDFLLLPAHTPAKMVLSRKRELHDFPFFARMEFFRADGSRVLDIPICGKEFSDIYVRWFRGLASALPWEKLDEVHIHMLQPPESLLRMALCAPQVTFLELGPSALSCMQKMLAKGERCSPFLPTLRTLVACGTFVPDHLQTLLEAREDASPDHPLETLVLEAVQAESADIAHLIDSWRQHITHILIRDDI
jgi:hypothetical protein